MSKVSVVERRIDPFLIIEFVFSIVLILDGLYLLSPDYRPVTGSVLASFVSSPLVSIGIASLYIITGVTTLWGVWKKKRWIRNISTSMLFVCFFFTTLIRLLTVGFVPTLWVWTLLLSAVAAIDNWYLNWKHSYSS